MAFLDEIAQLVKGESPNLQNRLMVVFSENNGLKFPTKYNEFPSAIITSSEILYNSVGENKPMFPALKKIVERPFTIIVTFDGNVVRNDDLDNESQDEINANIDLIESTISQIINSLVARKFTILGQEVVTDFDEALQLNNVNSGGTHSIIAWQLNFKISYEQDLSCLKERRDELNAAHYERLKAWKLTGDFKND